MLFHFLVGMCLTVSWALRPILYRPAAKFFPANMSVAFTGTWLVIGLLLSLPLLGGLLFTEDHLITSPYLLISIYKGATLFYLIKLQQEVNKESTSSSVFLGFIALAIGATVNNLFFNEQLSIVKILCIIGFGILGLAFLRIGDAKRLSHKGKIAFGVVTLIMASYMVSDHLAISQVGWYPHLFYSSVVMFIVSLLHGISKTDFKNIFANRMIVGAGVFYTISEFLVIYVSINILPVSIVSVYLRLSVPLVMIFSAIKYKEQSLKNQLYFGLLSLLLALPIMLIK